MDTSEAITRARSWANNANLRPDPAIAKAVAELLVEHISALTRVATGEVRHTHNGLCPDTVEGRLAHNPACPACQILEAGGDLPERRKLGEWEEGVLMAMSILMATHDDPIAATDVLRELGLANADCSELDDYDKDNLRRAQQTAGGRRLALRGLELHEK